MKQNTIQQKESQVLNLDLVASGLTPKNPFKYIITVKPSIFDHGEIYIK